jgi:hypothetical protein
MAKENRLSEVTCNSCTVYCYKGNSSLLLAAEAMDQLCSFLFASACFANDYAGSLLLGYEPGNFLLPFA